MLALGAYLVITGEARRRDDRDHHLLGRALAPVEQVVGQLAHPGRRRAASAGCASCWLRPSSQRERMRCRHPVGS